MTLWALERGGPNRGGPKTMVVPKPWWSWPWGAGNPVPGGAVRCPHTCAICPQPCWWHPQGFRRSSAPSWGWQQWRWGTFVPPQSTRGTLPPCRGSCGPIAPMAGAGQGQGWGLRTPLGAEQREEEDGGAPAALAAAKASHGLLTYSPQQTDPSSQPPPRVALRLHFPGPSPRFAPRNPRGRCDVRSQKSSHRVPGAHLSGTGPSLPGRGGRISLSRSGSFFFTACRFARYHGYCSITHR